MRRIWKLLFRSLFVIWSVITLTFFLVRLIPGGPTAYLRAQYVQQGLDPTAVSDLTEQYFASQTSGPLWRQYIDYVLQVLQGNLGQSVFANESISQLIVQALPWTLLLMSIATFLIYVGGIPLGTLYAYKNGSKFDKIGSTLSIILSSTPGYLIALGFLFLLGYQLDLFPTSGRLSTGVEPAFSVRFLSDALAHAFLPAVSMAIPGIAGLSIGMRGNSISVMGEDYLRVARLRGLQTRRIVLRYVSWNSILPLYTALMLRFGFMFGGAIIIEQIFVYEGMGFIMFQGIQQRDYPVMMGTFLVITITVTVAIFIAENTYSLIDPRVDVHDAETHEFSIIEGIKGIGAWFRRLFTTSGSSSRIDAEQTTGESIYPTVDGDMTGTSLSSRVRYAGEWARETLAILLADIRGKVGVTILVGYLLLGTVGVYFYPEPVVGQADSFLVPFENLRYPLGTNNQGSDMLGLLIYSIPPLFKMIFAGAVFAVSVATAAGTLAGYVGGAVDRVIMTVTDVLMVLPGLPLFIVLAGVFEPTDPLVIGVLLSVDRWAGLARQLQGEVSKSRDFSYVESSRVIGISTPRILIRDILPNILSYVTVNAANMAKGIIFASVGLYFLGVLPYTTYNWGIILNNAYNGGAVARPERFFWILEPMIAIIILSLGMILLSHALDRIFNPRLRTSESEPQATQQ